MTQEKLAEILEDEEEPKFELVEKPALYRVYRPVITDEF